eukprot:gene16943-23217_t
MPLDFPWRPWPLSEQQALFGAAKLAALPASLESAGANRAGTGRLISAVGLSTDIEDVHLAACQAGKSNYMDPATGYSSSSAFSSPTLYSQLS